MESLHAQALAIVVRYKQVEAELLAILQELETRKLYLRLGYSSMFDYAVRALGLDEGVAYAFINVSRKAREVPALQRAIAAGALTVSKARKITSVLTPENHSEWLEKAKTLPQRQLEREVAGANPLRAPPERKKYIQAERVALSFSVSEETFKKLERAQDLESKRQGQAVSLEGTVAALVDFYLEKKDRTKPVRVVQQFSRTVPSTIRHQVQLRDQGRCQYKNCGHKRWTEIHHIRPRSLGGGHSLDNLITLCAAHHRLLHDVPKE